MEMVGGTRASGDLPSLLIFLPSRFALPPQKMDLEVVDAPLFTNKEAGRDDGGVEPSPPWLNLVASGNKLPSKQNVREDGMHKVIAQIRPVWLRNPSSLVQMAKNQGSVGAWVSLVRHMPLIVSNNRFERVEARVFLP